MKIDFKKRLLIFVHGILLLAISLIMIIYPTFISKFIDGFSDYNRLRQINLVIVFLLVSKNLLSLFDKLIENLLFNTIEYDMKRELVSRVIYSSYLDIISIDEGKLINLNNDIDQLLDFYINFLSVLFKNIILIFGILYFSMKKTYYIGLAFVFMLIILLILFKKIKDSAGIKVKETKESYDKMISTFSETFNLLEEFYFIGKDKFLISRLKEKIHLFFEKDIVSNFISYQYWLSSLFVFGFIKIIILIIGFLSLNIDLISLGSLYLFIYYIDMIEDPIMDIRLQLETLPNIEESKNRVKDMLFLESSDMIYGNDSIEEEIDCIELSNIDFSYANKEIFRNYSFKIFKKIYVLSSPSGSGKSTLINLIVRLFDVSSGSIKYNGIDIRKLKKGQISQKVEYIDQKIELTNGELIGNIIPNNNLYNILMDKFGIDKRFDTPTSQLSSGEYRTLYLIKALLSDKDILILDELFLGIDDHKCDIFFDLLKDLDKIILIISHEERIVKRADEVIRFARN